MRYTPAGVERFPRRLQGPDGFHYGLRATVNVIAYNTQKVSAAEAPAHLEGPARSEVERPARHRASRLQRRDRHPRAGPRAPARLGLLQGAGPEQADAGAVGGGSGAASWPPASGRSRSNGGDYTFYQLKKKGNPVEIVFPKEGVPLVVSPSAITSFAPHPNAARLFTDFIFSREIQQVLADTEGLYTGHPEVKYPADRPKLGGPQAPAGGSGGAREAERGDQDALRGVLRRLARRLMAEARRHRSGPASRRARPRRAGLAARRGRAGHADPAAAGLARLHQRERRAAASPSRTTRACSGTRRCRRRSGTRVVLAFWVGRSLALAIGAPMAWLSARTDLPGRRIIQSLIMASFVTPPFLGAFAWVMLAGPNAGYLNQLYRGLTGAEAPLLNIFTHAGADLRGGDLHLPVRLHHDRQHARPDRLRSRGRGGHPGRGPPAGGAARSRSRWCCPPS